MTSIDPGDALRIMMGIVAVLAGGFALAVLWSAAERPLPGVDAASARRRTNALRTIGVGIAVTAFSFATAQWSHYHLPVSQYGVGIGIGLAIIAVGSAGYVRPLLHTHRGRPR